MKTIVFLRLVSVSTCLVSAQVSSVDDWNRERLMQERKSMKFLTIWGSGNLAVGIAGFQFTPDENEFRWASVMNAGFGAVNTTLGLLGQNRTKKELNDLPSLEDGYKDLRRTRNVLLVNAGLDAGYILAGVLLRDQATAIPSNSVDGRGVGTRLVSRQIAFARRRGFGTSLIVQGAALLIFDSITAWQLSKSEIHITPVLTPNGAGIGFQTSFEKEKPVGIAWF